MATPDTPAPSSEGDINQDYPHLNQDAVALLNASKADRVRYVHEDKFIMHENATKALGAMKDIYYRPKDVARPPCLAIIGNSNEGKTAVAERFFEDLGGDPARVFGVHDEMPVVMVEMPPRATEPRVCLAIARALGLTSYGTATKSRYVTDNVMRALVAKKVKMLILIEVQHVSPLPLSERQVVYDLIKGISNHGISVVAIGTEEARIKIAEDEQIANRMRIVRLFSFGNDEQLWNFLHTLERYYPLPKPSNLGSEVMANEIYKQTNGIVGEVVALCNAAAAQAIKKDLPCINLALLKENPLLPPANAA